MNLRAYDESEPMPRRQFNADQRTVRGVLLSGSGVVVGSFLGVPPAVGAHALGLGWMPYGAAVITIGVLAGICMGCLANRLLPSWENESSPSPREKEKHESERGPVNEPRRNAKHRRLLDEKACLDRLADERLRRADEAFGSSTESRIIWSELLELELQDVDDEVSRVRAVKPNQHSRNSTQSPHTEIGDSRGYNEP